MLSKTMQDGLNAQINAEMASANLYLSMAAWFEAENLPGSAAWMRKQAAEESAHAMKIFDYVNDRDGRVTVGAVAKPPATFKSAEEVWKQALAHEQKISAAINTLYAKAQKESDFASLAMLQWFVTEQVEEEKSARDILEQVRLINPKSAAMFFIDRHLGKAAAE